MKQKRCWIVKFLLCVGLLLLCACKNETEGAGGTKEPNEEGKIVLSDRQKEILQKEGLPTEYAQLTLTQKASIEAIEHMLMYLENTYEQEFFYAGYVAKSGMEEEHLIAECALGQVTLYRRDNDGVWEYEDNYGAVRVTPEYKTIMEQYVTEKLPPKSYKVFVNVDYMTEKGQTPFLGAAGTTYIFVEEGVGTDKFDEFVSDYTGWLTDSAEGVPTTAKIFLTDTGKINEIFEFNLEEMSIEKIHSKKVSYSISESGEVIINERER